MKLQIKFEKERFPVDIDGSATVKDLKRIIGKIKNCKISQIRLIYIADVLMNSQVLESVINDLNKPIHLFIDESMPKSKKKVDKAQNQTSENNPISSNQDPLAIDQNLIQFSQYVSNPSIRNLLNDPDVQSGLQMIRRGILICHDSGNTTYDHLLENLNLISSTEPYIPTPPPSASSLMPPANAKKIDKHESESKPEVDYEVLYSKQLQDMEEMGLTDKEINLKALIKFNGDLDDAVDWLIQENVLKE